MIFVMETSISPTKSSDLYSYVQLQQQIHQALRKEHPEWVKPNGDCPTCDSYESRLVELLGLSPAKALSFFNNNNNNQQSKGNYLYGNAHG